MKKECESRVGEFYTIRGNEKRGRAETTERGGKEKKIKDKRKWTLEGEVENDG